jgi:membrane protein YdbS with pleckstrin-like domain
MEWKRTGQFESVLRDHWITLLPHFFIVLPATGFLVFSVLFLEWVSSGVLMLLSLVTWGWFGFHLVSWYQRRYVLEHGRVHVLWGFPTRKHYSVQYHFPSLDLRQGPLGRILNYGSLKVGTTPNSLHIPRLNNFSLVKARLFGTRPQSSSAQMPVAQAPVVVQPSPIVIVFSAYPMSPFQHGDLSIHLGSDGFDSQNDDRFSGPNAGPYSALDEESVVSDEQWYENEGNEGEITFRTSYTVIHPRLRIGPSLFDKLIRSLRAGIKWGITLLLDYLDAIGEGVILAAQWAYRICVQSR